MINSLKGDVIGYENDGGFRDAVLEDVLKFFSKKAMVEIVKSPLKKKITKKAISPTIDSVAEKIIHILMQGDIKDLKEISPVDKNVISPLYLFLDKEVLLYAKLKNLKFALLSGSTNCGMPGQIKGDKKDEISLFIDNLEKNHPEIKRAIVNSYLQLYGE